MPGIVKIGFTKRTPKIRSEELSSSTGVPAPFVVEFQVKLSHPDFVEAQVHEALKSSRVNKFREFFKISPGAAKREVLKAASRCESATVRWYFLLKKYVFAAVLAACCLYAAQYFDLIPPIF